MRLWILDDPASDTPATVYGTEELAENARDRLGGTIVAVEVFNAADTRHDGTQTVPGPPVDLLAPRYEDESGMVAARFAYLAREIARLNARITELESDQ